MRRPGVSRPTGSKRTILQRAIVLFRPHRAAMLLLLLLISVTAALGLVPALIIREIVDSAIPAGDLGELNLWFGILIAVVVGAALLEVALGYVNQSVGQSVMYRLRKDLHAHLQRLSVAFYTRTRTGEILSRVSTDVNAVQGAVTGTVTDFLRNAITLTIAMGIMFVLEWRLALIAVAVVPIFVVPTIRVGGHMRRLMRAWHDEAGRMTTHLEETHSVSGAIHVKAFGRQEHEAERFADSNRTLRGLAMQRMMAARWFNMSTGLFSGLAPGAVYWFGGRAVIGDDLTLGSVVAFAVLTQRVFEPFVGIARINTTLLSSLAVFERIFEYLDMPVEVDERPDARSLPHVDGTVAFEHVTFRYIPTAAPAVDDVSFTISPGQMVALVGPSGAGKTTITYLIQRFYDPQDGAVRLDGHALDALTLETVARATGTVLQETYLFHASLADNIRYGRLDADAAAIRAAASTAGLDEFIDRLPQRLDTVVGERGFRLSGGEKQRVAIARAILKEPPVLILDEATASLDSRLEREIQQSMLQIAHGRTTIAIAHRLSTVLAADLILVMDRGRIVDRGRHADLLARDGLYATLYHQQFDTAAQHREAAAALAAPAAGGSFTAPKS